MMTPHAYRLDCVPMPHFVLLIQHFEYFEFFEYAPFR